MKGYKTAFTPAEVRKIAENATRHAVWKSLEVIYTSCCLAMLDHGIDVETVNEIAQTANGVLESIVFDGTKLKEVQEAVEAYGLKINFYGADATVCGERGKIR